MLTPDGFSAVAGQFLNKASPASGSLQLTATVGGSPRRQRLFYTATCTKFSETCLVYLSTFNFHLVLGRLKPCLVL